MVDECSVGQHNSVWEGLETVVVAVTVSRETSGIVTNQTMRIVLQNKKVKNDKKELVLIG